jgi:hypothetical protein
MKCDKCGKPGYYSPRDASFFHDPPAWGKPSSACYKEITDKSGNVLWRIPVGHDNDYDNGYYCEKPSWWK